MLKVDVKKNGIEKSLKILKSKVIKSRQNQILVEKKEFVKKSVLKRSKFLKASYIQKVKNSLN